MASLGSGSALGGLAGRRGAVALCRSASHPSSTITRAAGTLPGTLRDAQTLAAVATRSAHSLGVCRRAGDSLVRPLVGFTPSSHTPGPASRTGACKYVCGDGEPHVPVKVSWLRRGAGDAHRVCGGYLWPGAPADS